MSDDETAARAVLSSFGISAARLQPLHGGMINDLFRVDSALGIFALKQYGAGIQRYLDIERACHAQEVALAHGLPVPRVVRGTDNRACVYEGDFVFTLAEFIPGRSYGVDEMPPGSAYRMGVMLARLQATLAELPPGQNPDLLSVDQIRAHLNKLLGIAEARRFRDPVDERACRLIQQKLDLLDTLDTVPAYEPGWMHGDYQHTNVLFDDEDEVVGIIDFDAVSFFSPARDVLRCIALSFPSLGPAAFAFFEGYASARHLTPEDARGYVNFYRYISTYRVWPVSARYLDADAYNPRWDDLIQPHPDWDWKMLSDRFAEIAAKY